jgi:hypothetical protein
MTRSIKGSILQETRFCFPFRMILAGSSESGKTRFAGEILKRKNIFIDNPTSVVYFYPCYLNQPPVDWHNFLDIPVSYHIGLPTKEDLVKLSSKACVVLDDCYDEAIKSSTIDHLFRVISGKKKISVIIMTQNNFSKGKYGRDIRNSCNFSVLFRNCCDQSINENVARMSGLQKAFQVASLDSEGVMYPYFFLDQSQQGQLSPFRLYTNIFGKYRIAYSVTGMKGYVIGAPDFESFFEVISDGKQFTASNNEKASAIDEKNEQQECKPIEYEIEESPTDFGSETKNGESDPEEVEDNRERDSKEQPSSKLHRTKSIGFKEWRERIREKRANRRNGLRRPLY